MKAASWWLTAGLLTLLLGVGTYWLTASYDVLFPRTLRLAADPDCDLRVGRCERRLPNGGTLGFSIEPRTLPLMQPLQLRVDLRRWEVDGVLVDFVGLNMEMGLNRVRLQWHSEDVWHGTAILPVCSRQIMAWEAAVWLEQDGAILAVPHRFETSRD